MTTMCKISCLTAIATLVFIFPPAANHSAAEDPQPTISEQDPLSLKAMRGFLKKAIRQKRVKRLMPAISNCTAPLSWVKRRVL